jgi:glucosaminylphosphatidylinositol acyltransferase
MQVTIKEAKEAFVRGHSGTSVFEINAVAVLPAVLLYILQLLSHTRTPRWAWTNIPMEFSLLVAPVVVQLMGPGSPTIVLAVAFSFACLLAVLKWNVLKQQRSSLQMLAIRWGHDALVAMFCFSFFCFNLTVSCTTLLRCISPNLGKIYYDQSVMLWCASCRPALAAHRASLMIMTCVSILAVDFDAFPRRLAKAETFGTGLMDAGVGSIVVVSALAAGIKAASATDVSRSYSPKASLRRNAFRFLALLALGTVRPLVTAAVGYQQHVGEYGLHWNFFVTLAAVRILSLAMPRFFIGSPWFSGIAGVGVLAWHQYLLSHGLIDYVHSDERGSSFLSSNKEGILSLPGYLALHLLGCAAGAFLEVSFGLQSTKGGQRIRMSALVAATWATFGVAARWIEPVSRRACNATYVLWMLGLNLQLLLIFTAVAAALPALPLPRILQSVNDLMLPTFLAANVLTGLINLAFDTLAAGNILARALVLVYMAVLSGGAVFSTRCLAMANSRRKHQ